ncbi:MAG: cyclic nucleotide-binding domain-containing protein [Actinomycetota bacterium]|nr:cyclic nucleotide-binding domain-containing protein [Actinomycetota bacterium]MDH5314088.1 cyclic nucleotide-binding domain-containing protein [Actinomycetota bacterium]
MSQSLPDLWRRESGRRTPARQPEQAPKRTKRQSAIALAGVPLFADFSKKHLARLARDTDELSFGPGEAVVREGELGETLFVVLEGEGKVVRRNKKVGTVVPGEFFGELSAIDAQPRSASVVAVTPMRVLRLFRRHLLALLDDEPQLTIKLLDGIVRRIRQIDRSD